MFPIQWTFAIGVIYKAEMDYRDILKDQLKRRQELNPRYSLRSFSIKLGISPSKISEVFSEKKKLSVERLEEIAKKLNLKGNVREIFLASAELESVKTKGKEEIKRRIQKLSQKIQAEKTTQRNAWYFGAIKCLEDNGINSAAYGSQMHLTELQVENAKRFRQRIQKFYPKRDDLTFEPSSIAKKVNEALQDSNDSLMADFAMLDPSEIQELNLKIRSLIKKYKLNENKNAKDLHMIYFGVSSVFEEGL